MSYRVIQGDNRETLKTLADNSIDAIVTDPPYGIDFLGKDWDVNTGELETYQECLRVLKPGGHILAFSAPRTYHHLAMTLERAGFEIRDQIMWIYSSGFPKSQDVGRSIHRGLGVKETKKATGPIAKQWEGWGTNLKPAHEPICMARKPIKQTVAKNVKQYGTGAINIDATRIPADDLPGPEHYSDKSATGGFNGEIWNEGEKQGQIDSSAILKAQQLGRFPANVLGEIPDYQKYFYCPKVTRKERHMGIDNNHPTVKPVDLMEYLIKLITPPNGTVLDPYNGSGSTGMAAAGLGYNYIGLELDPKYVEISEKRIAAWLDKDQADNTFDDLFDDAAE